MNELLRSGIGTMGGNKKQKKNLTRNMKNEEMRLRVEGVIAVLKEVFEKSQYALFNIKESL